FADFDQAVRFTQRRNQTRSVACELRDRQATILAYELRAPELAPTSLFLLRERSRKRIADRLRPDAARESSKHRPHIKQKTDENGDRIAGKPENGTVADLPEGHRPPRLDRDLPQ